MPERYRKELWSVTFFCFVAYACIATSIGPVLPRISEEYHLDPGTAGLIVGLYSLGGLLALGGGYLSDRFDKATAGSVFALLYSTSAIGVALSRDVGTLGPSLLLMGTFAGFLEACLNAYVSDLFPKKRGLSVVLFHISWNIGSSFGPPFAAISIATLGGWRIAYLGPALVLVTLSFALALLGKFAKDGTKIVNRTAAIDLSGSHLPFVISTITFFYVAAEMGLSNWLASILEFQGSGGLEAGLINGLYWGAMGIGRLCWASITDRMGYSRTLVTSTLLAFMFCAVATLPLPIQVKATLWILTGFFFAPIFPTVIAWVTSLTSNSSGLWSGLVFSYGALGSFIATWSAGLIGGSLGFSFSQFVFPTFTGLAALDAVIAMTIQKRMPRRD